MYKQYEVLQEGETQEGSGGERAELTVRSLNARAEMTAACPVNWVM